MEHREVVRKGPPRADYIASVLPRSDSDVGPGGIARVQAISISSAHTSPTRSYSNPGSRSSPEHTHSQTQRRRRKQTPTEPRAFPQ
ncbi:hypothetical protein KIPB_010977, partial [Kipferlia bialata]|eukprot:g10977.t1